MHREIKVSRAPREIRSGSNAHYTRHIKVKASLDLAKFRCNSILFLSHLSLSSLYSLGAFRRVPYTTLRCANNSLLKVQSPACMCAAAAAAVNDDGQRRRAIRLRRDARDPLRALSLARAYIRLLYGILRARNDEMCGGGIKIFRNSPRCVCVCEWWAFAVVFYPRADTEIGFFTMMIRYVVGIRVICVYEWIEIREIPLVLSPRFVFF